MSFLVHPSNCTHYPLCFIKCCLYFQVFIINQSIFILFHCVIILHVILFSDFVYVK